MRGVCEHTLQLWARNCQFGLKLQQKFSHCKFCSVLPLPAQKANFVDFPRFPGSVERSSFLGGKSLGDGHPDRRESLFTVELFHPQLKLQKLTVLSGFQRKQKDLDIDRDCKAQIYIGGSGLL